MAPAVQDPRPRLGRLSHLLDRSRREGKKLAALARELAEHQARNAASSAPTPGSAWADALAGIGALDQPPAEREAYLWPDNLQAWQCWAGVQTQWRAGMAGATGLDYAGVCAYLNEQPDIERDARPDIFRGIQAAERATLDVWAEQRDRDHDDPPATRAGKLR